MLSSGRTGYLALFSVLLVYIAWGRPWWYITLGGIAVIILAYSAYAINPVARGQVDAVIVNSKMEGERPEQTSTGARIAMWSFAKELIAQKPIVGYGSGGYPKQAKAHFKDPTTCSITCAHTHNQFLFFGVENGLIGVALFVGLLVSMLRNASYSKNDVFSGIAVSYVAVLVVDSLTHGPFWIAREFYFFSSLMPLMLINASREDKLRQDT